MNNAASLSRVLPHCNIGGTDFTVDIRLNELRQTDEPWNRISLDDLHDDHGQNYLLYDQSIRNVYRGDPEHIPSHVILATLPSLLELDPIGLARKYGLADDALIRPGAEKSVRAVNSVQALQRNHPRRSKGRRI